MPQAPVKGSWHQSQYLYLCGDNQDKWGCFTKVMALATWAARISRGWTPFSLPRSLAPYLSKRAAASDELRPVLISVCSSWATWAEDKQCGGRDNGSFDWPETRPSTARAWFGAAMVGRLSRLSWSGGGCQRKTKRNCHNTTVSDLEMGPGKRCRYWKTVPHFIRSFSVGRLSGKPQILSHLGGR